MDVRTPANLSGVISYLFLLLCLDMKSFMKVEQKWKPSLSLSLPCSTPSDRGLKSLSSMQQLMCFLCLHLSRPARHPLFFFSFFPFSDSFHTLFPFLLPIFLSPFSSIFKQWNYSPLFFRVGVSAYPLMCQTNAWQVCLWCVIVPCLSDTKESCCWRAHLCLSCIIQFGICNIHTY